MQSVIFSLGNEDYGLPVEAVQEITKITEVYTIPKAPDYVEGLLNIRGQAIPLINMYERLGIKFSEQPEYAIVTEIEGTLLALAVREIKEVITLENISPPPTLVSVPFIAGIVNLTDRMIIQIYPEHILENAEIDKINELAV